MPESPLEQIVPYQAQQRFVTLPSGAVLALGCSVPLLTLPTDELGEVLNLIKTFDALSTAHQGAGYGETVTAAVAAIRPSPHWTVRRDTPS
jgi:hypothetical protein